MLAVRARALNTSGGVAAFAVGTITYASGGLPFALVLLAFFIPSTALSRVGKRRKRTIDVIEKGGARDARQVLANGGPATLAALIAAIAWSQRTSLGAPATITGLVAAAAFAGAYAAAAADTWGTEIGTLARGTPRSILTLRPITRGLSGGITIIGTIAELAGALVVALIAAFAIPWATTWTQGTPHSTAWPLIDWCGPFTQVCVLHAPQNRPEVPVMWWTPTLLALCGLAGAITDSILGATIQELRQCPTDNTKCETPIHTCGTPTEKIRGIKGIKNDTINAIATTTAAALAAAIAYRALTTIAQ